MEESWALFGYSKECPYGEFLGERTKKSDLEEIKKEAIEHGYTSFSYGYVDGSLPDFSKTVNL